MTTRDDDPGGRPSRLRASDTGVGPTAPVLPISRRPGHSGTRARIVAAARRQFGERGYDSNNHPVSRARGRCRPQPGYYFFGTKLRLFGEAVEMPFDPGILVASISAGPPAEQGTRLARFVVGLLKDPVYGKAFTGLVRAAVSDPLAAELLRDRLTRNALVPPCEPSQWINPSCERLWQPPRRSASSSATPFSISKPWQRCPTMSSYVSSRLPCSAT